MSLPQNPFAPSRLRVRSFFASGFTFVEILAALVFLGILIPTVVEGITLANRASVISERSAIACELAENKLNELTVDDAWASADTRGDFGQDWQGYRWQLTQSNWDMDGLTELSVEVFFNVQGRERSVHLTTLVSQATAGGLSQL